MIHLCIFLPLPPTQNHAYMNLYRRSKTGKRYASRILKPAAREWYAKAVDEVQHQIKLQQWSTKNEKTIVEAVVFFPDKRRRDVSNVFKVLLDALQEGGVYTDDKWALPRAMDFFVSKQSGIKLLIYPLDGKDKA